MPTRFANVVRTIHSGEADLGRWFVAIGDSLGPLLEQCSGLAIYAYDLDAPHGQKLTSAHTRGAQEILFHASRMMFESLPEDALVAMYSHDIAYAGDVPPVLDLRTEFEELHPELRGWSPDILGINARCSARSGVHIAATRRSSARLSPRTENALRALAGHLALAARRRTAIAGPLRSDDTVLSMDGSPLNGRPPLPEEVLNRAALHVHSPARSLKTLSEDEMTRVWDAFVANDLHLLELHDTDGRRFLVLRDSGGAEARKSLLTAQENAVAVKALLGVPQKVASLELQCSEARISMLRAAAFDKLGASQSGPSNGRRSQRPSTA